ncbi:unnamed protein product [Agarophyton chilense]
MRSGNNEKLLQSLAEQQCGISLYLRPTRISEIALSMSFFHSEDGSEDEVFVQQKRFRLGQIKRNLGNNSKTKCGDEQEETEKEPKLLSEEQELEQLRKHNRYQAYSASRKVKQQPSLSHEKLLQVEAVGAEKGVNISLDHMSRELVYGAEEAHVHHDAAKAHRAETRIKQVIESRRKRRKTNHGIDPKIIDDSPSDYSSESDEGELLGPTLPQSRSKEKLDILSQEGIPIERSVQLGSSHTSYVTGISIDNAGNRLVSVSLDSTAKMWDFNSMNSNMTPFRTFKPLGESPLRTIECSISGGLLLCSGRASSAVVTDREGNSLAQTTQGDMYIVDPSRTKGHTASIAAAKWSQCQDSTTSQIITTSLDGTIRVWDVNRTSRNPMTRIPVMTQLSVKRLRNRYGSRIIATAFDWMQHSHSWTFGCSDGTVKVLDVRSNTDQPGAQSAPDVRQGQDITGICCSPPSMQPFTLVRSSDDCLRVYDFRRLQKPIATFENLPNSISETNVCFLGPSGDIFATGTSTIRKTGGPAGSIRFFSLRDMKEVKHIEFDRSLGSVIHIMWKESLNQLIVGTGSGGVLVYYDTIYSHRGVLNCLTKTISRKIQGVASVKVGIAVPGSSLVHSKGKISKRISNIECASKYPFTVTKPAPSSVPPRSVEGPSTLAQYLSKQNVSSEWSRDPREALLQYADIASKNPRFTKVYEKTQPLPLLAEKTAEEEEEESRQAVYDRDRLRKHREHAG